MWECELYKLQGFVLTVTTNDLNYYIFQLKHVETSFKKINAFILLSLFYNFSVEIDVSWWINFDICIGFVVWSFEDLCLFKKTG